MSALQFPGHLFSCVIKPVTSTMASTCVKQNHFIANSLIGKFLFHPSCTYYRNICKGCWPRVDDEVVGTYTKAKSAWPVIAQVRTAGHSHWHNIRHIKAAKDAEKKQAINLIKRKLIIALKSGSADPKLNPELARLMNEAKAKNIPLAIMETTIKKMVADKDNASQLFLEARGLGNCVLVVECITDKATRTRKTVASILRKFGGTLQDSGAAAYHYDFKGVINVRVTSERPLTLDKAEELAIEAEAEEVRENVDEDDKPILQFICDPKDLHRVKNRLGELDVVTAEARHEYLPHTFVTFTEEQLDHASQMLDAIESDDDVVRVVTNIKSAADAS